MPVRPTVTLGDYESIRIAPEPVEVTDEMFDEQMEMIRRRFATIGPVERGAEWGDILTADIKGAVDDTPLRPGRGCRVPPCARASASSCPTSPRSSSEWRPSPRRPSSLPVPEDFPEQFANKTASITLTVKSVKEEELPDEGRRPCPAGQRRGVRDHRRPPRARPQRPPGDAPAPGR